jgi:hypothetical protein
LVWRAGKQARIEVNTKDGAFLSQVPADTDQRININKASPSTFAFLRNINRGIFLAGHEPDKYDHLFRQGQLILCMNQMLLSICPQRCLVNQLPMTWNV